MGLDFPPKNFFQGRRLGGPTQSQRSHDPKPITEDVGGRKGGSNGWDFWHQIQVSSFLLLISPSFVLPPRSISGTEKTRKFLGRGHYIGTQRSIFLVHVPLVRRYKIMFNIEIEVFLRIRMLRKILNFPLL